MRKLKNSKSMKKLPYGTSIQLYSEKICILSDYKQVILDINKIWSSLVSEPYSFNNCNLIRVLKGNKAIKIYCNDNLKYQDNIYLNILSFLDWFLNNYFLKRLNKFIQIHAGAVSLHETGIILPAVNDVGKSTFTLFLLQKGFNYYSDEIALINPKLKKIFPFPKSLSLQMKSELFEKFDNKKYLLKKIRKAKKVFCCPKLSDKDLEMGVKLKAIIFLRRKGAKKNPLTECPKGEAIIELVKNSFNPLAYGEKSFETLTDLIADVKTFYLNVSNLKRAYKSICEVVS